MSTQPATYHFETAATSTSVDKEKGVIYGVSLITSGITAKGHDLEVDKTTLEQMLSCAEKKGKLPVKWNHKTGADAVSGYIKNFRIEGAKLVGDWHLLKSHERFNHALELASEMPECLGLSTSFRGEDEVVGERKFARCTELVSADLVASPAANPNGFFEEKTAPVDSAANDMADKPSAAGAATATTKEFSLADVMAGINQINGRLEAVETQVQSFEAFQNDLITSFKEQEEEEVEEQGEVTDFADASEALHYLHSRLSSIEDEKEQAQLDHAFSVYDAKVEGLVELNEQLALENAAMAEALKDFEEATGRVIEFQASDEGGYEHSLSATDESTGRPLTEFEARCKQFESEGKSVTEAINLSRKENPARYTKHLQSLGVIARSL
jgi:hypothetical protein